MSYSRRQEWDFASVVRSRRVREGRRVARWRQRVDLPTPGVPEMAMLGRVRVGMLEECGIRAMLVLGEGGGRCDSET